MKRCIKQISLGALLGCSMLMAGSAYALPVGNIDDVTCSAAESEFRFIHPGVKDCDVTGAVLTAFFEDCVTPITAIGFTNPSGNTLFYEITAEQAAGCGELVSASDNINCGGKNEHVVLSHCPIVTKPPCEGKDCPEVCKDEKGDVIPCPEVCKDEKGDVIPCPEVCKDEKGDVIPCPEVCKDEKGDVIPCPKV